MKKYLTLTNIILILVFIFAFIIRIWGTGQFPAGFTQDEASFGYDAYSLLKTGKDQWGVSWPLVLRSFGDFKLPLYSYLTIPSVALFGLNEFATRLPNAIFGFFAVVVTYLMVSEMTKDRKLAFLSTLFLAISPWHISLSRGAFEANLTSFFMTAGVWTFLKGLINRKWMFLSSLFFGLNLFSYHSARILTPIIFILLIIFFYKRKPLFYWFIGFLKEFKIGLLVFMIFLILALGTMFIGGGKRGADILITNPTDKWGAVSDRRYEAVLKGLPDEYSRLFSNKLTYTFSLFYRNYISYLSPIFFFSQGAGEWTYGMIPGRGILYLFELFTISASLISIIKGKSFKGIWFILFWIILSPISAAVTKGPGYAANRVSVMMPAIQVLSAYGLIVIYRYFLSIFKSRFVIKIFYSSFLFILLVSTVSFCEDYFYHASFHSAKSMHYGIKDIMTKTFKLENDYQEIRVSRSLSVPQIWIAFYSKWDPSNYQRASSNWLVYQNLDLLYVDQLEGYRLGKYSFGNIDVNHFKNQSNLLIIGKPEEFSYEVASLETSYYPDGSVAYRVVESEALK